MSHPEGKSTRWVVGSIENGVSVLLFCANDGWIDEIKNSAFRIYVDAKADTTVNAGASIDFSSTIPIDSNEAIFGGYLYTGKNQSYFTIGGVLDIKAAKVYITARNISTSASTCRLQYWALIGPKWLMAD